MKISRTLFFALLLGLLTFTSLSACSTSSSEVHLVMTPLDQMPTDVQSAPVAVQVILISSDFDGKQFKTIDHTGLTVL